MRQVSGCFLMYVRHCACNLACHTGCCLSRWSAALLFSLVSTQVTAARLDIPEQTLAQALDQLAEQADFQILYVPGQVTALQSAPIHCDCSVDQALDIMLKNSGLDYVVRDTTAVIRLASEKPVDSPAHPREERVIRSVIDMEEIQVTAQKRQQSLRDVPIAINVLNGELSDAMGVQDTDDIESLYPNLTTNNRSVVNSGFAIRGVGTNTVHVSPQQSVGINIDDIATVSPFASAIGVFDLDRIEISRGPQNTLYGRNTIAGVVNYHSREASVDQGLNGRAVLKTGNGGLRELEGGLGFPMTDHLALRIALMNNHFDGTWTNLVDGSRYGADNKQGLRINSLWEPAERTSLSFTLGRSKADGDNSIRRQVGNLNRDGTTTCAAYNEGEPAWISGVNDCWSQISSEMIAGNAYLSQQLAANNTDMLIPNPDFVGSGGTDPMMDYLVNYSSEWGKTYQHPSGGYSSSYDNARFKLIHVFDNAQLTWHSAYDRFYIKSINANDLAGFEVNNEGDWDVFQQDIRLMSTGTSNLQWLLGLFYNRHHSREDTWIVRGELGVSPAIIIDSDYRARSVYGQFDFALNPAWSITLGARYTEDKLQGKAEKNICTSAHGVTASLDGADGYDRAYRAANHCPPLPLIDNTPTQELRELGWKAGIHWKPAGDSTLLYANLSKGFKGGAYDNRVQANGDQPIDPEYILAYELGSKLALWDNRLQLNAAAYWYDWQDLQVFATTAEGEPLLLNIPSTELKGLELEAKWAPTNSLTLQGSIAFSDNKITELTGFQRNTTGWQPGYEVTNAPDISANIMLVKRIPLASGELSLQGFYRYMSDYYYYTAAPDENHAQARPHDWISGRLLYAFGHQLQHSVALWGNNLTAEKSITRLNISLPGNLNFPGPIRDTGERMWGITLETRF